MQFPSLIDSEHGKMITILVIEFGSFSVSNFLLLSRPVEDILDREHGDYGYDFIRAS